MFCNFLEEGFKFVAMFVSFFDSVFWPESISLITQSANTLYLLLIKILHICDRK